MLIIPLISNSKGVSLLLTDSHIFFGSYIDFKEVHFVRLLSVVLQELDHGDIPDSILAHVHLKNIIHPL